MQIIERVQNSVPQYAMQIWTLRTSVYVGWRYTRKFEPVIPSGEYFGREIPQIPTKILFVHKVAASWLVLYFQGQPPNSKMTAHSLLHCNLLGPSAWRNQHQWIQKFALRPFWNYTAWSRHTPNTPHRTFLMFFASCQQFPPEIWHRVIIFENLITLSWSWSLPHNPSLR